MRMLRLYILFSLPLLLAPAAVAQTFLVGEQLTETTVVAPLGLDPPTDIQRVLASTPPGTSNVSLAAFRVEVTLPAGLVRSLPGGKLQIAIETELMHGVPSEQTPAGFPRSQLRTFREDGRPELRPVTTLALESMLPAAILDAYPDLRFQKGANRFLSPWVVAIADPRASIHYPWPAGVSKAAMGCRNCERPAHLQGKTEADGVFELYTNGRFIRVRPELVAPGGASLFAATGYAYLGERGRMEARVRTYMADTAYPADDRIAAMAPPPMLAPTEQLFYPHTGSIEYSTVDYALKGRGGLDLVLARTYSSAAFRLGPFGRNMDSPLLARIRTLPDGSADFFDGTGRVDHFAYAAGTLTPPPGVFLDLTRTADGAYILVYPDRTMLRFDQHGRLLSIADRNTSPSTASTGNQILFGYNAAGDLATIYDPAGRRVTVGYDAERPWLIKELRDFEGRTVTYDYDAAGRLTTVAGSNPASARSAQKVTTYTWAAAPAGANLRQNVYGGSQLLSVTDGLDRAVVAMTYQPAKPWSAATVVVGGGTWQISTGEPELSVIDPRGFPWKYAHDTSGNVTQIVAPPVTPGGLTAVTTYGYDARQRLQSTTKPLGERTTFAYGASGEGRFRKEANVTEVRSEPRSGSAEAAAGLARVSTVTYGAANLPTQFALSDGTAMTITRDTGGNATEINDGSGGTVTAAYDTYGRVTKAASPRTGTMTVSYDAGATSGGYLRAVTTPLGTTTYTTDARGNVVSIQDPSARVTTFEINRADQIEREVRAASSVTYSYDAAGNVKERAVLIGVDDAGTPITSTTAYTFDALGRELAVVESGRSTTRSYDPVGNLLAVATPADVTSYTYDARNRVTTETRNGKTTTYVRDEGDAITHATDARGKTWNVAVTGFGVPIATSDPYGVSTVRVLDPAGRERDLRVVKTQPDGTKLLLRWRTQDYDGAGRLVRETQKLFRDPLPVQADGSISGATDLVTSYAFDDAARTQTVIDPLGQKTVTEFDEYGRALRIIDAAGNTTAIEYTETGSRRRVTRSARRPDGTTETQIVLYDYDRENRLVAAIDMSDPTHPAATDFAYDARGNTTKITDPDRNVRTYGYDLVGNRVLEVDGAGAETAYTFDAAGRVLTVKDAKNHTTTFTYTADGAIETEMRADGSTWRYGYDANGNRTTATHPTGTVIEYRYDDANRLVEETIARGDGVLGPTRIGYGRDELGRVTLVTTSEGVKTAFAYDSLDRVVSEATQIGEGAVRTIRTVYDGVGNPMTIDYPSGLTIEQTFTPLRLLETVKDAGVATPIARYAYVAERIARKALLAAGIDDTWTYDPAGRIEELLAIGTCAGDACTRPVVRHIEYGWSPGGTKMRVMRPDLGTETQYDYTKALAVGEERLDVPLAGEHPQPRVRIAYGVDPVLNYASIRRSVATIAGMETTERAFTVNERNQYTSDTDEGLTYDKSGNLITAPGAVHLGYDYAHRLKMVRVAGGGDVEFFHDGMGRLVAQRGAGGDVDFVPAGDRVAEEYRAGALARRYVYGRGLDELVRVDGVTGTPDNAVAAVYPLQDELGTVECVLDATGATIERYAYEGYGRVEVFDASGAPRPASVIGWNRYFHGRPRVSFLDAYDFRARTLWTRLRRFAQEDPAGMFDSPNLYQAFKARWPVLADPFGESVERGQIVTVDAAVANLEEAAKSCKRTDAACVIRAISAAHRAFGPFNSERYVFTERGGWLDLRHLYELANQFIQNPDPPITIERVGELIEEDQAVVGHPSAFSFEDLPTNHRGVTLGRYLTQSRDAVHTARSFLRAQLGAARTFDESVPLNPIINFSIDPVLSPRDPTLVRRGPWTYKPSGYAARDTSWLKMMNDGLKKNPQRREVRTTDPETLVMREVMRIYGPVVLKSFRWQLGF